MVKKNEIMVSNGIRKNYAPAGRRLTINSPKVISPVQQPGHVKHVPGNSSYRDMTNNGKKTLLPEDSICSHIKMREINKHIINGYIYRKSFPGLTAEDMDHYCLPTLIDDKPNTCIIHAGPNSLYKSIPEEITCDILNTVEICKSHGVNDILVSGIPYKVIFKDKVSEINSLLWEKQLMYDFTFIENGNIDATHIERQNICSSLV